MVKYPGFQALTGTTLTLRLLLLLAFAAFLSAGCSKDEVEDDLDATELSAYTSAQESLRAGNYRGAVQKLQLLEARFPFGRYAEQAQLELIYAYYKSAQSESARSAADRYIRLHPSHPNVDYAYYLKGLVNFERGGTVLDIIVERDLSAFDRNLLLNAYNDFKLLLQRFVLADTLFQLL